MNDANPCESDAIKHVEEQHEGIRSAIAAIHRLLTSESATRLQIASELCAFCVTLDEHFHTEEDEGFFEQITEHAPRLSSNADKLCEEHNGMLVDAKALVKEALDSDGSIEGREKLSRAFHDFGKRLMQHEGEENELLQQAYTEDIGSKD